MSFSAPSLNAAWLSILAALFLWRTLTHRAFSNQNVNEFFSRAFAELPICSAKIPSLVTCCQGTACLFLWCGIFTSCGWNNRLPHSWWLYTTGMCSLNSETTRTKPVSLDQSQGVDRAARSLQGSRGESVPQLFLFLWMRVLLVLEPLFNTLLLLHIADSPLSLSDKGIVMPCRIHQDNPG